MNGAAGKPVAPFSLAAPFAETVWSVQSEEARRWQGDAGIAGQATFHLNRTGRMWNCCVPYQSVEKLGPESVSGLRWCGCKEETCRLYRSTPARL